VRGLTGACFVDSHAAAKQIALRFDHGAWLGIHLGMSGELRVERTPHARQRHDHLVLEFDDVALVYEDPRMFGRVRYSPGPDAPAWWTALAPPVLSRAFTIEALTTFLRRRARAPIKAVLLMQEQFPGIGNWMADEVLWRAAIHPRQPAGSLRPAEIRRLWLESRRVCRLALDTIAGRGDELPRDLNVNIPQRWLFRHRWSDRGTCPRTGRPLARAEIGGRTTCWSPARQKLRRP
ncbi:MAG TPA: DNA-formamidopyrimidine glycosylase family protein, partial [Candidatus Synoicihabitans sp.]|nr:DNA-formamidopyrimidine glycosylase family protein [Candidatus Synoicihabitans sp.]